MTKEEKPESPVVKGDQITNVIGEVGRWQGKVKGGTSKSLLRQAAAVVMSSRLSTGNGEEEGSIDTADQLQLTTASPAVLTITGQSVVRNSSLLSALFSF